MNYSYHHRIIHIHIIRKENLNVLYLSNAHVCLGQTYNSNISPVCYFLVNAIYLRNLDGRW